MRQFQKKPKVHFFFCAVLAVFCAESKSSPGPRFESINKTKSANDSSAGSRILVSSEKLDGPWEWSAKAIELAHLELKEPAPLMPKGASVLAYRIKYKTTNLKGEEVVASGLVRVRSDLLNEKSYALPLISYQHSTRVLRSDAPSTSVMDPEAMGGVLYFASRGFVWAMPDYLGLGFNDDPQAYLHANGQARVCADFLKAVDEWASGLDLEVSKQDLVLMGYSQGGHTTLALQKFLESKENDTGFVVGASFPMAGPYSVAGVGLQQAIQTKSSSQLLFVALALYGLSNDPDLGFSLSDVISEKYENVLPELFTGKKSFTEVADKLPKKAQQFFSETFLQNLALQGDAHPLVRALKEQDVLNFKNHAPVYLIHAPDDETVSYQNSVLAQKMLNQMGGRAQLITLDKGLDHVEAALPAFSVVAKKIQEL